MTLFYIYGSLLISDLLENSWSPVSDFIVNILKYCRSCSFWKKSPLMKDCEWKLQITSQYYYECSFKFVVHLKWSQGLQGITFTESSHGTWIFSQSGSLPRLPLTYFFLGVLITSLSNFFLTDFRPFHRISHNLPWIYIISTPLAISLSNPSGQPDRCITWNSDHWENFPSGSPLSILVS